MPQSFCHVAKALKGAPPRLFQPMYAVANMGHPSRNEGFVLCSNHGDADELHLDLSGIPAPQLERYRHTCFAQFIAVGSVLQSSSDDHAADA
jgi:hypothetical protein